MLYEVITNYRSTGNILAAANAVIGNNHKRREKQLWTAGSTGEKISLVSCQDADDEARAVVERIHQNLLQKHMTYRDNAIRITSYNVCYTKLLREFRQ